MEGLQVGYMTHYLGNEATSAEEWNLQVDSFNVEGLAEQLVEAGAGHFLFTLGQNSGRYAAPNATYDSIVGRVPSFLSTRDLMSDLYEALSRRGIKLLAYLPSGCPENDTLALQQFRYEEDKPRRRPFQQMWEAVIREWSVRWGTKVEGWFFDGCYAAAEMYSSPDPPNFASFAAAARAGNPNAVLMFNDGAGPGKPLCSFEDLTAGEIWQKARVLAECPPGGQCCGPCKMSGRPATARWHLNTYVAGNFGGFGVVDAPRFSDKYLQAYTLRQLERGGAITWDVPIKMSGTDNGLMSRAIMPQLRQLKNVLRPGSDLAFKRPRLASSGHESASFANDGDNATSWTSHVHDTEAFWQVDLGMPYYVTSVDISLGASSLRSGFEIRGSNDPENRTFTVLGRQPLGQPLSENTFSVSRPPESSLPPFQYLRMSKSTPQEGALSLSEFRVTGRWVPSVNVAAGRPAVASSGQSTVHQGNDGRPETAWSSDPGDSGPWWQVDLGQPFEINMLEFLPPLGSQDETYRRAFEFRASNSENGADFVVLGSQPADMVFPPDTLWSCGPRNGNGYRYVRVVKTDGQPFVFQELRVYGTPASPYHNAVPGKPVTASSVWDKDRNLAAAQAADNLFDHFWSSQEVDIAPFWQVDLLQEQRVVSVELTARQDDCDQPDCRSNFEIRGSNQEDGSSYTVLARQGSDPFPHRGTWAAPVTHTTPFRYIRLAKLHGTYLNACTVRVQTGPPVSPDLALGKPAEASSSFNQDTGPAHGNDGDLNTIWASEPGDPAPWWQVDLGQHCHVSSVSLTPRQDGDQDFTRRNFGVAGLTTPDDPNPLTLAITNDEPFPPFQTWHVPVVSSKRVRYVRVSKTDSAHFNFAAFSVLGMAGPSQNLALRARATASSEYSEGTPAMAAVDGRDDTIWASVASDAAGPWWQVDLGGPCLLTALELTARQDEGQAFTRQNFEVRGADTEDNSGFAVLAGLAGPPFEDKGTWRSELAEAHTCRYLRVVKTDGSHFNFAHFRAFGFRLQ